MMKGMKKLSNRCNPKNYSEQIEELEDKIEDLESKKQDKDDENIYNGNVVEGINQNRSDIDELSGQLEIKAFVKVEDLTGFTIGAGVERKCDQFTKIFATNSDILDYNETNQHWFITQGFAYYDMELKLVAINQEDTLTVRSYDYDTLEQYSENQYYIEDGVDSVYLNMSNIFEVTADVNIYITFEFEKFAHTVEAIQVITEESFSGTATTQNVLLDDSLNESVSGTAYNQKEANTEFTISILDLYDLVEALGNITTSDVATEDGTESISGDSGKTQRQINIENAIELLTRTRDYDFNNYKLTGVGNIEHRSGTAFRSVVDGNMASSVDDGSETTTNYWTVNVKNTVCNTCGFIDKSTHTSCPKCDSNDIDYATRVIGYLKRVKSFSNARQHEEQDRAYSNEIS